MQLIVSDDFPTFWDVPQQTLRWPEPFTKAFPEIAVATIGEYLDNNVVPKQPDDEHYAAVVNVSSDFFSLFTRPPQQDDTPLLRYIGGKLFWAYRLGADSASFGRHDAIRFGITVEDLHQVAWQADGILWRRLDDGSYQCLQRLLTDFRSGILPGQERTLVEQLLPLVDRDRYPAALVHIEKAVGFLRGPTVDLENAAKESVNAVESMAKVLLSSPTGTLGDCIKDLRRKNCLPREIARILESLYTYRNATPGVGHGATDTPSVSQADADFILGVASVSLRYLAALWPSLRSDPAV